MRHTVAMHEAPLVHVGTRQAIEVQLLKLQHYTTSKARDSSA